MTAWEAFKWAVAIGIGLPLVAGGIALAYSLLLDARDEWRSRNVR